MANVKTSGELTRLSKKLKTLRDSVNDMADEIETNHLLDRFTKGWLHCILHTFVSGVDAFLSTEN